MATFVQLTEEDPAYDLAGLLAQINHPEGKEAKEAQQKELSNLVAAHEYTKIIDTFFNSMDKVLAAPEKDINTVFNMCFSLISQLSAETATQCVGRFVSALTKDQQHALLKLKLLSTLFNLLGPSHRHHIFLHILRFALSTNQTAVLSGQFESLESWTRDWKVSTQEEADLYLLAAQTSRANNQPSQHQRFLLQYLKALEKGTADQRQAAKEHAISAIKTAIDSTAIADCDTLLRLQAVTQLADDSKQRPAFELLQIVSQQNVESYSKYASSHRDFIAQLGLDHERLLRKMRHLTICSLGADHTVLPYATIQQHLSLPAITDVEEQVIEAVASGLLDAKLDQEQQLVHIQRATARTFNQDTWKGLAEKLELWKRNVRDVLGVVMQARAQGKLPQ